MVGLGLVVCFVRVGIGIGLMGFGGGFVGDWNGVGICLLGGFVVISIQAYLRYLAWL